ncbi:MAG: IS21 family transposase [Rhodospirillaceae bacterium]|nr:IS21 family transposase [Rhodospirillaceae bacterium]
MYGWETRMLLKHYLDQGISKAELSRRFGVNRRTIHYWIETGQLDRELSAGARGYAPRPPVAHKLDPYKAIIDARLEAFPKLSAKRLFDEVRAAGYAGCYSRVSDYVRAVRPREPVEAPVRFETPAGRQGQVDFGTFTLPWGRRHALVIVLGYSRLLWLRFYPRQTMTVLMEGLEGAFARFGGVPEELLFDQMRAVVLSDDRAAGGGLVLNAEFLRFAAHWGFVPRSCRPYRARTKGKVERPIRYIREGFFYGREFANDNDLNEQAVGWLEATANLRRHATTGKRPADRFERDERAALLPLADCPYRRLGVHQAPEPKPRRLPATVEVERRPLSVYAEALQ